jgi:hypothetical protein
MLLLSLGMSVKESLSSLVLSKGDSRPCICDSRPVIPPELQGRFFTLNESLLRVMAPLGLAVSGPLSDLLGARAWTALAGVSCMVIGVARALTPYIRQIEDRVPA